MWQRYIDEDDWIARVNSDAEASLAGRWSAFSFDVVCSGVVASYGYAEGVLSTLVAGQSDIVLDGSDSAWRAFLERMPTAPNHHVLGMDRRRDDFAIAGGRDALVRNLRVLTRVLEIARLSRIKEANV